MKTVILAGGLGTRISEESHLRPKPMIEIGGLPIIWHIMKHYSHYGFNEFVICCGYKGYAIKNYFANYYLHASDITLDFTANNAMTIHNNVSEPWKVTLIDTGRDTGTGGRIARVRSYLNEEPFFLTYGDGVSDINLTELLAHHQRLGKTATITAVQPGGRFGVLKIDHSNSLVQAFREKAKEDGGWVNGGFMVLESDIFTLLHGDNCTLEEAPMATLSAQGELAVYKHEGFWRCMDTQRDKQELESLWMHNVAPWRIW